MRGKILRLFTDPDLLVSRRAAGIEASVVWNADTDAEALVLVPEHELDRLVASLDLAGHCA
jgi:hypothetical protein